jgi:hypothetical protein
VLFTTYEGTFENNDLVITCQDIFPMDLGNSTFTAFSMSEDVASYMAQNIELFECDCQLVHSHHQMAAWFSGTDLATLQAEGNERNCFVSLIVNNAGTYCAAVTRKVQTKSEVTVKNLGKSYEFFGEGEVNLEEGEETATKTIDSEVIEYFMLDIEKEEVDNPLDYLDKRFEVIQEKKKKEKETTVSPIDKYWSDIKPHTKQDEEMDEEFYEWLHSSKNPKTKQLSLFDDGIELPEKDPMEAPIWLPKKEAVHKAVVKIVTCSLIISPVKFNLDQWIDRHMVRMYKEIFGEEKEGLTDAFDKWKEFAIDFYLDTLADERVSEDMTYEEYQSIAAEALLEEIGQYYNDNIYMKEYYDMLTNYIC